jgi:serine/threonine-protein kinase
MTPPVPPPCLLLLSRRPWLETYRAALPDGAAVVKRWIGGHAEGLRWERRMFERECRLLGQLSHPGLPALRDAADDWFAIEALDDDESRAGASDAAKASLPDLAALLTGVAEILAYLHGRGILHNDIKPEHVRFRAGGRPVLIDLGLASLPGEDNLHPTELRGSPAWMAPERILHNLVSPAGDIWSLGAVMASLTTGLRPYAGSADAVLAMRRAFMAPAFADALAVPPEDDAWRTLLRAMMGPVRARPAAAEIAALLSRDATRQAAAPEENLRPAAVSR